MLHGLRRRLEQRAQKEAGGASFWTSGFEQKVRTRAFHLFRKRCVDMGLDSIEPVAEAARELILEQEGLFALSPRSTALTSTPTQDFMNYMLSGPDDMFPTVIEALVVTLPRFGYGGQFSDHGLTYAAQLNEMFEQERVAWEIVDKRMVPFESKEMHQEVAIPALRLLHEARFAKADEAFRDALRELSEGHPSDAITDAGTALQEVLGELGWEGNSLGKQIGWAKKNGLLRAHDNPLIESIEKTLQWVSADRSEMGDAHKATSASREDAWLAVHVVGALIVRFASGLSRNQ
jgi:hypothetical protein